MWGEAPPDSEPVQRVAVGGPRQRLRPLLLAGAVVGLLAAGLVLGQADPPAPQGSTDRDAGPSTDRSSSSTTTTTTSRPRPTTSTTAVPVPILPGSGAQLIVSGRPGRAELIDLDTGATSVIELGPFAEIFDLLPVRGGVVAMLGRDATYLPLPTGEPVPLGEANYLLPAGPDAVWLMVGEDPYERTSHARLVDLQGTPRTGPIRPPSGWIAGAWDEGLIVQAGGRIYTVDLDGELVPLAVGEVISMSEGRLVARVCDDAASCALAVWRADQRSWQNVRTTSKDRLGYFGGSVIVQPDGDRAAFMSFGPEGSTLSILDLAGGPPIVVEEVGEISDVAWLPRDLGLVAVERGELLHVRLDGNRAIVDVLQARSAEFVTVITP